MTARARAGGLGALVYGALCVFGLGCGPRGCSCGKLPTQLLGRESPTERVWSDVDMVTEGSEPRVSLRVARWTGLRYRFVVEGSGSMSLEGQPPAPGPTIVTTLKHEVLRGSTDPIVLRSDGGVQRLIEERAVIESIHVRQEGVSKEALGAWNLLLQPLQGTALRQRISESAGIVSVEAESRELAPPPSVRQMVESTLDTQRHFPFRLPPLPVGIGARWRFHDELVYSGIKIAQIAEMSLKAIDATTATVGIVLRQQAERQQIPHPFLPGKLAIVEAFRGDGQGELTVDRLTAVVLQGRLLSAARVTLTGEVNGQIGTATLAAMSVLTAHGAVLSDTDVSSSAGGRDAAPDGGVGH